jgi:hypothetical protein
MKVRGVVVATIIGLWFACLSGQADAKRKGRRANTPAAATEVDPLDTPVVDESVVAASADRGGDVRACTAAYKSAEEREQASHLVEARELWAACAKASCGSFLLQECTTRYTSLDGDIPSVVPLVTDQAGVVRLDVEVTADGAPLASHLDGRALLVDPGMHEFKFKLEKGVTVTQKILILQGQRNRQLSIVLSGAGGKSRRVVNLAAVDKPEPGAAPTDVATEVTAAEEDAAKPPTPKLTYVLGATGALGLGGFALLTYWGRKDNDGLGQCKPDCPHATVQHIHNLYLLADISLGAGIVAIGAAYWAYVRSRSVESGQEQASRSHEEALLRFDLQPTRAGALAGVSGTFR